MKVRQKWKSLALCFLMLMTLLPLSSMTVRAEETLFNADNGMFIDNKIAFDGEDCSFYVTGTCTSDNKYKFLVEYKGKYYYQGESVTEGVSDSLETALGDAKLLSKGNKVSFVTNLDEYDNEEDFRASLENYKVLVYDEEDNLKYTIKQSELQKYASNTNMGHDLTITCTGSITNSTGKIVGKNYKLSGCIVNELKIIGNGDSYEYENGGTSADYEFGFLGKNGDYTYEATLCDGYVTKGSFNQSGVFEGQDLDAVNSAMGTVADPKNPTLTFSNIPKKKCESFELTISSDIDAQINFNGQGSEKYSKKAKFTVDSNGTFFYSASTADGGYTEGSVKVSCIKDNASSNEKWVPDDWNGEGSDTANPNIVQTGIFGSMKFLRYIGLALVLLGCGILVAKKKGISFKKGGKQS